MPRGGYRPGAKRPVGTGKFKEPTQTMRVPVSAVTEIQSYLEQRMQQRIRYVDVTPTEAARFDMEMLLPANDVEPIHRPLFSSRIAAGFPSPADDHIADWLDLSTYLVSDKPATFYLRVIGLSMIDEDIRPNDLLIVNKGLEPQDGDIVIAVLDGELTVKELEIARGKVRLIPANPDFAPVEVREDQQLMVWGVVTAQIREHVRGSKRLTKRKSRE